MSPFLKYSGVISALIAFVGYHYLEIYHGYFGTLEAAESSSTFRQVSRSVTFITSSWKLSVTISALAFLIVLTTKKFKFSFFQVGFSRLVILMPLIAVVTYFFWGFVRSEAKNVIRSELSVSTTSFRELLCISSTSNMVMAWYDSARRDGQKILISYLSNDRLTVFLAPESLDMGLPYVDLIRIGISNDDILIQTRATERSYSVSDEKHCAG